MSSKSHRFWLKYDDATIFKMAAVRHLEFLKFKSFCSIYHYYGWICVWDNILHKSNNPLLNYGQNSVIQYGARPPSWIFKFKVLVTYFCQKVLVFQHINLAKIGLFWLKYGDIYVFKMAAVGHLEDLIFNPCVYRTITLPYLTKRACMSPSNAEESSRPNAHSRLNLKVTENSWMFCLQSARDWLIDWAWFNTI